MELPPWWLSTGQKHRMLKNAGERRRQLKDREIREQDNPGWDDLVGAYEDTLETVGAEA